MAWICSCWLVHNKNILSVPVYHTVICPIAESVPTKGITVCSWSPQSQQTQKVHSFLSPMKIACSSLTARLWGIRNLREGKLCTTTISQCNKWYKSKVGEGGHCISGGTQSAMPFHLLCTPWWQSLGGMDWKNSMSAVSTAAWILTIRLFFN